MRQVAAALVDPSARWIGRGLNTGFQHKDAALDSLELDTNGFSDSLVQLLFVQSMPDARDYLLARCGLMLRGTTEKPSSREHTQCENEAITSDAGQGPPRAPRTGP